MKKLIKIILCFYILLGFNSLSYAKTTKNCKKHKIYCAIKKLRPNLDDKFAMRLSNSIHKYSKIYKMDPLRSIAIIMTETSIREMDRLEKVIVFETFCNKNGVCFENYKVIEGSTDVSIYQFHVRTIMTYKINPVRLKNDLNYATGWHFRLLKEKMNICKGLGDESWSCYHSATKRLRLKYVKKVNKFYKIISNSK